MRKNEIEFVVGYCIAKFSKLVEVPLDPHDPFFEPWVKENVTDALSYLDTREKFESDVLNEIDEILRNASA